MPDESVYFTDDDNAIYHAEIVLPDESYRALHKVDLVRESTDEAGLTREQRLTVGEYASWMEAEEHLYEVETVLEVEGTAGLGDDIQTLRQQPISGQPQYLTAIYPPDGHALSRATLLEIDENGVISAPLGEGERADMDRLVAEVDPMLVEDDVSLDGVRQAVEAWSDPAGEGRDRQAEETERHTQMPEIGREARPSLGDDLDRSDDEVREYDLPAQESEDSIQHSDSSLTAHTASPDVMLSDMPTYDFTLAQADAHTLELRAEKTWEAADGMERAVLPLREYETAVPDDQLDGVHETAAMDVEALNQLRAEAGLEAAIQQSEDMAIELGTLEAERDDPRLFTDGPLDPFQTTRELEIDDELAKYGVTWRETQVWEQNSADLDEPAPYWHLDTLPVHTPDGDLLGHAAHIVVYDGIEQTATGSPDIPDDEPFRMLEMAHFETTEAVDKFGQEFHSYVVPGLLDGPELAEEVARLEGHPVEWRTLDAQEREQYHNLDLSVMHEPQNWKPYNPNAERDARIEAEGLYTDPIHQFTIFDEDEVEPIAPDFDL